MLSSINRMLCELKSHTGGSAILLTAIGLPILIGGAGAAVDFSQWYSWKHELQQATDQGALASAWAMTKVASSADYQVRGKQDYVNNLALTAGFASAPTIKLASYSNGNNNSVVVSATATKMLPFSSFITGRSVTVSAYSQASFKAGNNYSACLIAVGKNGTTFTVGGNANVVARCGLAALSCSNDALTIDSSATVVTDSIATCGTATVPTANQAVLSENVSGLKDIFGDLSPPTNNTPQTYKCVGHGSSALAAPAAGTYTGGLTVSCKTTLGKGIYVINGGTLDLSANYPVTGTNVMFVLKNGATLKLGGSGNAGVITLTPMQSSDFSALGYSSTLSDRYANMLIFEDRNNNPSQDHIINGNSNSLFQGTIYLPAGTARLNGTASIDSSCLQISANKITVSGNAYLDTRCSTQTNDAGTAIATVNLVA
jgi:Flp pilus assembly protein TadG